MRLYPPLSSLSGDASLSSRTLLFSSSSSSLSGSPSSVSDSPFDSPFHGFLPPSAVPFSWERRPGIPKLPPAAGEAAGEEPYLLPLPPQLRSAVSFSRKKRSDGGDVDPFALALAQCAKVASPDSGSKSVWRRATIADRIGLASFYGSCKTAACSVSNSTITVPRSARSFAGSYGRMNRRAE